MKKIDQMLDQSEYLLRGIKSIAGAVSNVFRKAPVSDSGSLSARDSSADSRSGVASGAQSAREVPSSKASSHSRHVLGHRIPCVGQGQTKLAAPSMFARGESASGSGRGATTSTTSGTSGTKWGDQEQVQVPKDANDQMLDELSVNLGYLKELGKAIG